MDEEHEKDLRTAVAMIPYAGPLLDRLGERIQSRRRTQAGLAIAEVATQASSAGRDPEEWFANLSDDEFDQLSKHINDIVLNVHPLGRVALTKLAADSMAQRISSDFARDAGRLFVDCGPEHLAVMARMLEPFRSHPAPAEIGRGPRSPHERFVLTRIEATGHAHASAGRMPLGPPGPNQIQPGLVVSEPRFFQLLSGYTALIGQRDYMCGAAPG